jgi:hypothetical protein
VSANVETDRPSTPPRFRTVDEVAAELRKSPRWLRDWLRRHPGLTIPRIKAGRTILFDDAAVRAIHEALRVHVRQDVGSSARRRVTTFPSVKPNSSVEEALRLVQSGKRQHPKKDPI